MKRIKKRIKIIIAIFILMFLTGFVFLFFKTTDFSNKTMNNWNGYSESRKNHIIAGLINDEQARGDILKCMDLQAESNSVANIKIKESVSICYLSSQLKNYI